MKSFQELKKEIPGLMERIPLAPYTTWNVGGPATFFVIAKNATLFTRAVRVALQNNIPYFILGLGSNILFSDSGFPGLVIKNESNRIRLINNLSIRADAGVKLARVASFATKQSLTGIEFGVGIPGTIGGGCVGNAGMKEFELKNIITRAWVIDINDPMLSRKELSNADLQFSYRHSLLKEIPYPVIQVELKLKMGNQEDIKNNITKWSRHRIEHQPIGEKCAGSTFRNPEGDFAGRILDKELKLKGYAIGGARFSEKHANFIINDGSATSHDVFTLIMHAKRLAKEKMGITLQEEVQLVGFDD